MLLTDVSGLLSVVSGLLPNKYFYVWYLFVSFLLQAAALLVKFPSSCLVLHSGSRSYPASCFYSDSHHLQGLPGPFPGASQVQSQRDASGIHLWCHLSSLWEGRVCSLIYIQCTMFLFSNCMRVIMMSPTMKRKARASWNSATVTEWGGRISHTK